MKESLFSIPISFLVWLVVCAVACVCMLIVQLGFVLYDIRKEEKKNEPQK